MATIKAFTDLEQSKKLAKILSLKSADFGWNVFVDGTSRILPINDWELTKDGSGGVKFFRAWSLAALLNALPKVEGGKPVIALDDNYITYPHVSYLHTKTDNLLIDACYEMILKLHELKLL